MGCMKFQQQKNVGWILAVTNFNKNKTSQLVIGNMKFQQKDGCIGLYIILEIFYHPPIYLSITSSKKNKYDTKTKEANWAFY